MVVLVELKTVRKNSFRPPVIEDWNYDDESKVKILLKDKTVSSSTEKIKLVKSARETVEKVKRPVWNNSSRVNHKNFANKMTHPHPNRRFVPQAVLTRSGKINTTGASVNTAVRPVNTIGSKPTVNHPRSILNAYKRGYSQVTRPFIKYSEYKNNIFNKEVNTVKVKDTTTRDRAVVSKNKGNGVNAVKASACWGNPQQKKYKEKRVIDSGCSRHMIRNKCYLTEYEDYDGGFVSFGDGQGRISRKGKIKTGTLDFDNVYFCKELKYNLFSVSQICDKKNNVLFTDTECLVLSSDFKLLDESQVLLRVPRKDNIYSVDLKSVVPTKGLTCLFAKATIDESNLWHRRLGHINFKNMNKLVRGNLVRVVTDDFSRFSWVFFFTTKDETSGILKTFITEIENQLDHKVKVIRCDNGTEFKNSVMNQFCEMKGIKREFSVARTPQQNGVAKRRNRTLIKATQTMLVDSKLPTTFWAEAINTACYVLNRVLVIKPHKKIPYELIHGRTPLIDFMKPFGCPLAKPKNWLFDVDSLIIFMNYVPVVAGNQTNGIAGTRDNIVTGQTEKKKEPEQEYILIPICTTDPLISQDHEVNEEDAEEKPTEMDESGASDKDGKDDQATKSEFEMLLQQEKQTVHTNSTNSINTVSTTVSTVGPSFINDNPSSPVNVTEASNAFEEHLFESFSPFKNAFSLPPVLNVTPIDDTGIFVNAYDDEDVGAEADLNNLETTMNVSPIPTTRIDKDHPKDQIIRDFDSAIQTRRMTKIYDEHAMVCYINKQRRTNHKDYQNCLFACFLSQIEPKKVIQALEDPSWIEAMQEELLQFQIQKVWTLVNPPNGKRAIGTKWVFRNKNDKSRIAVRNKERLVAQGFIVYQIDVKSTFLYGTIEEEVYVCQPPSFEDPQSPDKVYVDDIIFGSTKKSLCDEFEGLMHKRFQMSSMGGLTFFLGLQVQQKKDEIFISQDKYMAEVLKKFDFATMKTTSTPMEPNKALLKDEEADSVDVYLYKSMIGSLMYLTTSRPDIMFAVCACARDSPFNLEIFSDSDYAGASLDRKSTTRGCQFLGKRLISWQCKKQTIVANSTTEAEYVAAANCCRQVLWIQNQMLDYGFYIMNTKIYIDNESTICIMKNPVFHSKTKHIEIRHHFIRDSYGKKLIQVIKIHIDHNVADHLTKAFDVSRTTIRTTVISQSSGPINHVADETVYKEWEDRIERAATTASSLDAKQDSGNINRTQSMATLNESFPQGTDSGSGPRCQDTILGV
ncbi:putative ribonuclease H-like domain-containing protein [Tanacetum coccineum]